MADIDPQGGRSITIKPNDSSISVAQAIYHHVTARTENIFEDFSDNYIVCSEDVTQLGHKLEQVAQRHHQGEASCEISHAIFKKERIRHTSLQRFEVADRTHSCPTSEIILTYDFLCTNPFVPEGVEVKPERYKVTIRVTQEHYLRAADSESSRPDFLTRMGGVPSIQISIRYVDYTVGRALLAASREWVEGLPKTPRSKVTNYLLRHQFSIGDILPKVLSASVFLGASVFFSGLNFANVSVVSFSALLAVVILAHAAGSLVSEAFANQLYFTQNPTLIKITRGDDVHATKVLDKKKKAHRIVKLLFGAVLLALIVNVSSNLVYDKLFASTETASRTD